MLDKGRARYVYNREYAKIETKERYKEADIKKKEKKGCLGTEVSATISK